MGGCWKGIKSFSQRESGKEFERSLLQFLKPKTNEMYTAFIPQHYTTVKPW